MARSHTGSKGPGWEYWSARPGNRCGGHHSPNGHNWQKRATHKAERRTAPREVEEQLADVYTVEEFMADICTTENPCPWCRAKGAQ